MSSADPSSAKTVPPVEKPVILVADDDADLRELVCMNLQQAGFQTVEAEDGLQAVTIAKASIPSALVLDVMMPGRDGFEVCRLIRDDAATQSIPVLMLTARDQSQDRIAGLQIGADDYVTKPFSPKELVLRVQALVRRAASQPKQVSLVVGPFELDLPNVRLLVEGEVSPLTMLEFKLLHLLASHPGIVVPRDTILREVWGYSDHTKTRTLDTHVKRLREKLGDHAAWLRTIRGHGYLIGDPSVASEGMVETVTERHANGANGTLPASVGCIESAIGR